MIESRPGQYTDLQLSLLCATRAARRLGAAASRWVESGARAGRFAMRQGVEGLAAGSAGVQRGSIEKSTRGAIPFWGHATSWRILRIRFAASRNRILGSRD